MTEVVTDSSEIDVVCCPFEILTSRKNQSGVAVLQLFKIAEVTNLGGEWHFRTLVFSDLNNIAFSAFQQAINLDGGVINHCQHTMYNSLRFYNLYS